MQFVKKILITAGLITLLVFPATASAQEFTFGLRPEDQTIGYFQYHVMPGDTINDAVLAVNGTEETIRLVVSTVAGHTGLTGGISFPGEADGPAQWLTLPDQGVVEIPAKMAVRMPFTLNVPEDTPPGEYVAGFLSTPEDPSAFVGSGNSSGSFQVQVIPQMGVSVIIIVSDPTRCDVRVDGITLESDKGQWQAGIQLSNIGNIHFKGTGKFILRQADGGDSALEKEFSLGYFVIGDTINYPLYLDGMIPAGDYLAEVQIIGGECVFQTQYKQPVSISHEQSSAAEAEAASWESVSGVKEEVQFSELLQNAGFCLFGLTAFLLVVLIFFMIFRRQKRDSEEDGHRSE